MRGRGGRLLLLGVPTFGMALAVTAVSTYLPVVARGQAASTALIGGILAIEGLMALWLPIVAGSWSDRLRTPLGGRLPFVLAGTPAMFAALCLVGLVHSLVALAGLVVLFFVGYFVAYEPYRALYPDLVESELAGRSQSVQAGWRGAGTGTALISGAALLGIAEFLPFVLYAVLLAISVGLFVVLLLRGGYRGREAGREVGAGGFAESLAEVRRLLRERPALRCYLLANGLWETSLGATKTFVILYVTAGLGYSLGATSLIVGGVALVVLAGAVFSGTLADRHGRLRVSEVSVWVFGGALLVPGLTTLRIPLIVATPFVALGGGTLMSLPYSLLMPLMPEDEHGAFTGLYGLSRGLGVMAGPLAAGLAIELLGPLFGSTHGYAATWWVAGGAALLSLIPLRRLRALREDHEGRARRRSAASTERRPGGSRRAWR
ncbi:MAG TPA: MFS transporter [Solirubrobacterales bacterium]|nr:MFS transporter [Solirubrobacterales bacterium]